ncbi:MAG TPA: tRNA-dihydrouridine synthase [Candidatus Paceibacterota bacterium]|nr:tRNA-dihydrouridine synthase [Candidatus Paceibacterota bacterium]
MDFWHRLPKPFFVLAPMEDVTDAAFRSLISSHAAPEVPRVLYTEFTSADGLLRADTAGKKKLLKKLEYTDGERPIVAQLFTSVSEHMEAGAKLCRELGFDGFDINMGCPDRAVERQGCGSALIRTPEIARELIRVAKRGAGDMPVSVKTRIGYNTDELETWLPELLAEEPSVVTLHLRTRKEMSEVPAHWDRMARAIEIRDALNSKTLIVGNGDVRDLVDARDKAAQTGCDGVMLGRAVFGNPWIFSGRTTEPTREEKILALIEHITFFEKKLSGFQNDAVMKRHFKAYIGGWDGAKELRQSLMEAADLTDAREILKSSL